MPTLTEMLVAHIDGRQRSLESGGARPLEGTDRTIRHKRRVRQGTTASIAVIAGGALATSGAVALKRAMDQEPSAYYLPDGGGEVTIPVDGPDPTTPRREYQCGDPAPVPVTTDDGFELGIETEEWYQRGANFQVVQVDATVSNVNEEQFPAFVLTSYTVVTQDGVVVGYTEPYGITNPLPFTPTRTEQPEQLHITPYWQPCDTNTGVVAGDYDVFVISTVANSPEIASLTSLNGGFGPPAYFDGDTLLQPTDWECSHDIISGVTSGQFASSSPSNEVPCVAGRHPLASWDPNNRTMSVRYGDGRVSRVFETTLISSPIAYTVTEDLGPWTEDVYADPPTATSHLTCDVVLEDPGRDQPLYVYSGELTGPQIANGESLDGNVWLEFGPRGVAARSATVSFEERARVYFTESREERIDDFSATYRNYVVGWGVVTVGRGNDVSVGRAVGPTPVTLEFDAVSWCGSTAPEGEVKATLVGDVTIASDGGTEQRETVGIFLGAATN